MSSVVVDSYAWIEYFEGSQKGAKVKKIVEQPANTILTSAVSLAELVSKFRRQAKDDAQMLSLLKGLTRIRDVDEQIGEMAGVIHAQERKKIKDFGLADAIILATAETHNAKVLTGDQHFRNIRNAIML